MSNKAVFLDRDGVINRDYGYVYNPEQFHILPGVFEALLRFQAAGFKLIIITNQAGIARGFYTDSDLQVLHSYMLEIFRKRHIYIDGIYFCPHHPSEGKIKSLVVTCKCRKPGIEMIQKASKEHRLNLNECWLVGDKLSDIQAGNASSLRGSVLVNSSSVSNGSNGTLHYYQADDLLDSCRLILE